MQLIAVAQAGYDLNSDILKTESVELEKGGEWGSKTGKQMVQEGALTAVASIADSSHVDAMAWVRLCKCLGQGFLPYKGFVMPPLLQSAQLKPDVTITSADSDAEFDEEDERLLPHWFLLLNFTSMKKLGRQQFQLCQNCCHQQNQL